MASGQSPLAQRSRSTKNIRKKHQKSRTGCTICKQRRVKCDEEHSPGCRNCRNLSIKCSFITDTALTPPSSSSDESLVKTLAVTKIPRRGRPRRDWSNLTRQNTPSDSDGSTELELVRSERVPQNHSLNSIPQSPPSLVLPKDIDLKLFHHFLTQTSTSLADEAPFDHMWQFDIPKFAVHSPEVHRHILHLIMAVSASHLDKLRGTVQIASPNSNTSLADLYFNRGLSLLSPIVPQFGQDPRTDQSIYISSWLLCYYIAAQGPIPGDYLIFAESGQSQFRPLLRGFRQLMILGGESLSAGPLSSRIRPGGKPYSLRRRNRTENSAGIGRALLSSTQPTQPSAIEQKFQDTRVQKKINEALRMISCIITEPPRSNHRVWTVDEERPLSQSLKVLWKCYDAQFQEDTQDPEDEDAHFHNVMVWPFQLSDSFVSLLTPSKGGSRDPRALLLVAYFCPLLQTLDHIWWLKNWAKHVLKGVTGLLLEELKTSHTLQNLQLEEHCSVADWEWLIKLPWEIMDMQPTCETDTVRIATIHESPCSNV